MKKIEVLILTILKIVLVKIICFISVGSEIITVVAAEIESCSFEFKVVETIGNKEKMVLAGL